MKNLLLLVITLCSLSVGAQEMQTLFGKGKSSGGYGAVSNKFTTINGDYMNIAEVYGGWLVNRRFMLGLAAAGSTNDMRVPLDVSAAPNLNLSFQYAQAGLMMEYALWPKRAIHFNMQLFSGPGFTTQYQRFGDFDQYNLDSRYIHDENWFFVVEPGVQLEMNLFRWMRLSPGISWRNTYGSNGKGLSDASLSNVSYNVALKFGKFW